MEKYGEKFPDKFYQCFSSLPSVAGASATAEVRSFIIQPS